LFPTEQKRNRWCLVGSRDGRDESLTIHQDVNLYSTDLDEGAETEFEFGKSRQGFLQLVRGSIEINGEELGAGDAVTMQDQAAFTVRALREAELLFFDMAAD
jgi:redox-sensitive bicupin YhaK (pirin superfamily)